jgi:hypothetical protein
VKALSIINAIAIDPEIFLIVNFDTIIFPSPLQSGSNIQS